jgi:hypothetical protein
LALFFLWAAFSKKDVQPTLRGATGIALGLGLAAFYIAPAAYEQRWVNISGALAGGLTPRENFLFAVTTDAEHDAFNRFASYVGLLLIVWIFAVALAVWRKSPAEPSAPAQKTFQAMIVLGIVATVMMVRITDPLWTLLPKLRFVQFPWRLMAVLAVVLAFVVAMAARRALVFSWIALALIATLTGTYLVKHTWWDTEDVNTVKEAVDTRTGFEGTDEYDPLGDDHTDVPQKQPEAQVILEKGESESEAKPALQVLRWTAEDHIVAVKSARPVNIRLRLLQYPAWLVSINGRPAQTHRTVSYDAIVVAVPAGESRIEARFKQTADRAIGECISAFSALAAGLLAWPLKRRTA